MAPHDSRFIGLAPLLRASIAGADLRQLCSELLAEAERRTDDADAWMNLSIAMLCLGQRELGLTIQARALAMGRVYRSAVAVEPAAVRLLLLVAPGDLSANAPLDCLLQGSDVELTLYYLTPDAPFAAPVPDHDVLMVGLGETAENHALLALLEGALENWPRPVINPPRQVRATARDLASRLLQGIPGLRMPPCARLSRVELAELAEGGCDHLTGEPQPEFNAAHLREGPPAGACAASHQVAGNNPARLGVRWSVPGLRFPLIVRPLDSHGGHGLVRIDGPDGVRAYLERAGEEAFFVSNFVDYAGADGLFRKYRIALVDGVAHPCHLAISSDWVVHYVSARMYQEPERRAEEERFMEQFERFSVRHHLALTAIHQRTGLDYLCVDCAETADGALLVFEVDHAMVVHAMDDEGLFPYKQPRMRALQRALRGLLLRRIGAGA